MTNQELKRGLEDCLAQLRADLDYAVNHCPNNVHTRLTRKVLAVEEVLKRLAELKQKGVK